MPNLTVTSLIDKFMQAGTFAQALSAIGAAAATSTLYDAGVVGLSTLTFDYALGAYQKISITSNTVIQAPLHPSVLSRLEVYIKALSADETINFDGAITQPSDSSLILPKTLTSGKSYIVLLKSYNGTSWNLISLEGGF